MKKTISLFFILFTLITLASCSSVDGDAKEAAELNKKSISYIKEQNLEKAEELYKKSQKIIARYKGTEQYAEFHQIYSEYLHGEGSN